MPSAPQGALQVGQFTVDPAEAVVKPGCKQQVSVVFRAEANRAWAATLGLDISERDPRDQHNGIPYELVGDSCIPGEPALQPALPFETCLFSQGYLTDSHSLRCAGALFRCAHATCCTP